MCLVSKIPDIQDKINHSGIDQLNGLANVLEDLTVTDKDFSERIKLRQVFAHYLSHHLSSTSPLQSIHHNPPLAMERLSLAAC